MDLMAILEGELLESAVVVVVVTMGWFTPLVEIEVIIEGGLAFFRGLYL